MDLAPRYNRRVELRVECYAGARGDETPRRLVIDGRPLDVAQVVDRWLTPDHRFFRIRGGDGAVYVLRQDVVCLAWELTREASGHL